MKGVDEEKGSEETEDKGSASPSHQDSQHKKGA